MVLFDKVSLTKLLNSKRDQELDQLGFRAYFSPMPNITAEKHEKHNLKNSGLYISTNSTMRGLLLDFWKFVENN